MYDEIIFNSIPLNVTSVTPVKEPKTIKQVIGKSLTEIKVRGLADTQWRLSINGKVLGTTSANLDTNRTNVEGLDDVTPHTFTDGITDHAGTYICVPGSVQFEDVGEEAHSSYSYSLVLVEQ